MDSVTDYDVFVWLRKFIQFLIPDLNVIRIQSNRNALPKGDFATMALLQKTRLATNARIYTNKPDLKIKDVFQSLQLDIQLDFLARIQVKMLFVFQHYLEITQGRISFQKQSPR